MTASMLLALALTAACATLEGPPEEVPPEAPTPRLLFSLSPGQREKVFPAAAVFNAREWLERLACPVGDQPGWKQTARTGSVFAVTIECPGLGGIPVALDTGAEPPPAPPPLRQLALAGVRKYREALAFEEKREFEAALDSLDAAIAASPEEGAYRRERVYVLFELERVPEAIVEADVLLETDPTPLAWKFRALAAKALGLRGEVLKSLEGILETCDTRHPLFAEAMCAKGMMLTEDGDESGETWMRESCSLKHEPCCTALDVRRQARLQARRAAEALRALPLKIPPPPASPAQPSTLPGAKADEPSEPHDAKADSRQ